MPVERTVNQESMRVVITLGDLSVSCVVYKRVHRHTAHTTRSKCVCKALPSLNVVTCLTEIEVYNDLVMTQRDNSGWIDFLEARGLLRVSRAILDDTVRQLRVVKM